MTKQIAVDQTQLPKPKGPSCFSSKQITSIFLQYKSALTQKLSGFNPFVVASKSLAHEWKKSQNPSISFSSFFSQEVAIKKTDPLSTFGTEVSKQEEPRMFSRRRPTLESPSMFCMIFDAHKMVSNINHRRLLDAKREIEYLETQREVKRNQKLQEWKKQREKSELASRWSTAMTVFSWISSCLEIFTGMALIATGNVVGGSLLLAGGVIQLSSHIMMQTGGWDKVAEVLPGDDLQEKKKVVSWMQIGIGIFSMMLAGAGGATVGMGTLSSGMQAVGTLSMSGLMIGNGIVTIGHGIYYSQVKETQGNVQKLNVDIQRVDFQQQYLRDQVDEGIKFDKRCYQLIVSAIKKQCKIYSSLFRALST